MLDPYRSDELALRARRTALSRELEDVEHRLLTLERLRRRRRLRRLLRPLDRLGRAVWAYFRAVFVFSGVLALELARTLESRWRRG